MLLLDLLFWGLKDNRPTSMTPADIGLLGTLCGSPVSVWDFCLDPELLLPSFEIYVKEGILLQLLHCLHLQAHDCMDTSVPKSPNDKQCCTKMRGTKSKGNPEFTDCPLKHSALQELQGCEEGITQKTSEIFPCCLPIALTISISFLLFMFISLSTYYLHTPLLWFFKSAFFPL